MVVVGNTAGLSGTPVHAANLRTSSSGSSSYALWQSYANPYTDAHAHAHADAHSHAYTHTNSYSDRYATIRNAYTYT